MLPTAAEPAPPPLEVAIARLAGRQHGVISRGQLRHLGLGDAGITARARAGRLHRLHRGVYAVGHPVLVVRGRWMAAVLAAGPGAVLSHASAAALWELRPTAAGLVDVTRPGAGGRARRPGIRLHRARSLEGLTTMKDGIPVTTPGRTILDLAATLDRRGIERLLDRAEHARLGDALPLDALARAHAGHRGAAKVIHALADHDPGSTVTKSALEERLLTLCRDAGLPKPTTVNDHVEGLEADFVFRAERVLVETDGWRHHKSRESFEKDRLRDAIHAAAGWRTLRFTHRQLTDQPTTVIRALRTALRAEAASAPPP